MDENTMKVAKFVQKKKMSLMHIDTVRSFPVNDGGILWFASPYVPVSHFGKLKKDLMAKLRLWLNDKKEWNEKISKIWDEELEISMLYKLGSKYSGIDVDNLNKYMIDSMKGILFKDDTQVKLIVGRKDEINETHLRGQCVEKAIVRIDLFSASKVNATLNKIFRNGAVGGMSEEN